MVVGQQSWEVDLSDRHKPVELILDIVHPRVQVYDVHHIVLNHPDADRHNYHCYRHHPTIKDQIFLQRIYSLSLFFG